MEITKKNSLKRSTSVFMCTQRAIRVKFFRNGDKYFTGFTYPISFSRYKDFDILLKDLSNSAFCDKSVMPCGVRSIFDIFGTKIKSVNQMEESSCYVCSGSHSFIALNYIKETSDPIWKTTKGFVNEVVPLVPLQSRTSKVLNARSTSQYNANRQMNSSLRRTSSVPFKLGAKIINIIRNATGRPRNIFQWLLNTKSAPTFGKVLDDLSTLVKLDSGFIKHVFLLNGREVTSLKDFFGDDINFIVIGTDTVDRNSLIITAEEYAILEKAKKPNTACVNADSNGLQKLTDKYMIGNEIGVGNFAVVKECRDKKKKQMMAVKVIDKRKCDKHLNKIYQEMTILKKIRHTNVIELINNFETPDFIYLIMDLSQDGNMVDFILGTQSYSEQDLSGMIHNISAGLFYLHSINIIHRDIKFENVLIDRDMNGLMRLKICDFGLATEVAEGESAMVLCGSPHYMAPEIFHQEGYTNKVDVWALGVLFHVLLFGEPPYVSDTGNFNEIFDKILQSDVDHDAINKWNHVSDDAKMLLNEMLEREPSRRLTSSDVLSSPWVAEDNIAANANLWPVIANRIIEFLRPNENIVKVHPLDFLAKTSLDKDSNIFESAD